MNNLPFNTQPNANYNSYQQNNGYSNQYNPPPPTMTFSIVEGRTSVDNFLVGTNVTAILADFTNNTLYIKERDANNILRPLREFELKEKVQQYQSPIPQAVNAPQPNNDERYNTLQNEMNDMKQMLQSFISSQNSNKPNNNKGGNK